jgi:hypothetical protein
MDLFFGLWVQKDPNSTISTEGINTKKKNNDYWFSAKSFVIKLF